MLIDCDNKTALICRFLLFIFIGIIFSSHALSHANEVVRHRAQQFTRADVETIKTNTQQILSEQDFTPKKSFWQWLWEKFSKWEGPKLDLGPGLAKFLLLVIIVWCILALMAILIHFIWTIHLLIKSNTNSEVVLGGLDSESVKITSFKELYRMTQELAKNGEFHEAISIMMVALLRWLDSIGIIRFHESKTNGDYLREYPKSYASRNYFKRFVLMFEHTIYGGLRGDGQIYRQMNSLMENIHNSVRQKT